MPLTQTVEIPENRWLNIKVPNDVPTGSVILTFKPVEPEKQEPSSASQPLKCLVGIETPIADRLLGAAANLGNITLDEIRDERLTEKYLK